MAWERGYKTSMRVAYIWGHSGLALQTDGLTHDLHRAQEYTYLTWNKQYTEYAPDKP